MASLYGNQGYGIQGNSHPGPSSPWTHRRRTWSDNGIHLVVQTSSFHSPGSPFQAFHESANSPTESIYTPNHANAGRQRTGFIGAAFDLIEDVVTSQRQASTTHRHQAPEQSARQPYAEDLAYGDDFDHGEEDEQPAPRQKFMSRMTDKLLNSSQRQRKSPQSREHSPARQAPRRMNPERRAKPSHRTEARGPSWADRSAWMNDSYGEDEDDIYENYDRPRKPRMRRAFTTNETDQLKIQALQNAADYHRREVRKCRRRLEQASRQPMSSTTALQNLLNELKGNEKAYDDAIDDLNMAKTESHPMQSQPRTTGDRRRSRHERDTRPSYHDRNHAQEHDDFEAFFQPQQHLHPLSGDFDNFEPFQAFAGTPFGAFHQLFTPFGPGSPFGEHFSFIPSANFEGTRRSSGFSRADNRTHSHRPAGLSSFAPSPSMPPANLLKSQEAKQSFEIYNERWNALSAIEPTIPYPARGLQATALNLRDTIWAPRVRAPVSSWSEDAVMQANTQAFFLGVVGLVPVYSENPGTGRIVMGFDKMQATPEQVRELVDILKKEKTRWHSDRLGRRNGGSSTEPNVALQRDERARAVFHAVCELMQTTQEVV